MPLVDGNFISLKLPRKHGSLLYDTSRKWRTRVMYGGRNGAKDWSITASIIELCVHQCKRILFTRELQKSLSSSWIQLVSDQIKRLGYSEYFTVLRDKVEGINGSLMLFFGLNDLNSKDVKSTEGIDIAVIGEAEDLTLQSYNDLKFTVRNEGSEIWIAFNTAYEDDFVYQYFVTETPDDCIVQNVNGFSLMSDGCTVTHADNPFISDVQLKEAQQLFYYDRAEFDNQCLGLPKGGGGRVYSIYRRDIHLIEFDYSMLPECNLYMSIDPHYKYYPAIGWHAVTPTSCVVTYNEWPKFEDLGMWYDLARDKVTFDMSIEELAHIILAEDMTLQYGGKILSRTGDPRFFAQENTYTAELTKHGVTGWVESPFENIATQRNNIKSMMNYNPKIPLIGHNRPTWYVSNRCKNINRAYLHHSWNDKKDKETEDNKDFIDQDRYFMATHNGKPVYHTPESSKHSTPIVSPYFYSTRNMHSRSLR